MSKIAVKSQQQPILKTPQELVHIQHKITLRQYKYWLLMLRAYREAHETQTRPDESGFYNISIASITDSLGYEPVKNELRADLESVRREPIIYNVLGKDGQKVMRGAGFISEWEVSSTRVGFKLPDFLRASIEHLDIQGSIFQQLNWTIFNSFTGKYEAIIYKLCKDYVGVKRTPVMTIDDFRAYMGVKPTEYPDFKRLSQWCITQPVKRINESDLSDIRVETVLKREGRKVVAIQFLIEPTQQTMMDLGDDPAFRFARVPIPLQQQRKYLSERTGEQITLSIERANEYAKEQEEKNKIVNIGALYRKAIDEDWGAEYLSKKARETEKVKTKERQATKEQGEAKQKKIADLRTEFTSQSTNRALETLTLDERHAHAQAWQDQERQKTQGVGQGSHPFFDTIKGDFRDALHRAKFRSHLVKTIKIDTSDTLFITWLRDTKRIDPARLGLKVENQEEPGESIANLKRAG